MSVSRYVILFIAASCFLFGCMPPEYIIRFESVDGLQKEAPVIFEELTVGHVKSIAYEASGHFLVTVTVSKDFSQAVTDQSRFVIGRVPENQEEKAIFMTHEKKGGVPLKSGSRIQGQASSPLMDFTPFLEKMEKGFDDFIKDLKGIPESEQYRSFQEKMDELKKEMMTSSEAIQNEIKTNVLPKLRQEMEKLKKTLEDMGKNKEADSLEKQMNSLQDI